MLMTNETRTQIAQPATKKRPFLRLAFPALKEIRNTKRSAMSEQLSESHVRALFADDLQQRPLMSKLRRAVRAPSDSKKALRGM